MAARSRRRSSRRAGPRRAGSRGPSARRRARSRCGRAGRGRSGRGGRRRAAGGWPARAPPGSRSARIARRPVCAWCAVSNATSSAAAADASTRRGRSRPPRAARSASRRGVAIGQPDFGQDAGSERWRGGGQQGGHGLLQFAIVDGHAVISSRSRRSVGLERRSQHGQAAMDLGLDGALGSIEGGRHFGIAEPVDVAEDDGAAVGGRQGQQALGPGASGVAPNGRGGRARCVRRPAAPAFRAPPRRATGAAAPGGRAAADPGPAQVEHDGRQPRPEPELADARSSIPGERAVGADEGVLRRLLGVARIAQHPQRDRVEPVLVGQDEALRTSRRGPGRAPR